MSRLFAFGCSYTRYHWPTWANIIGTEFTEFYNWGYRGLGNRAIAERIAEAFVTHRINKDDTVIVQWSHVPRHDYIRTDVVNNCRSIWKTNGNIFNKHNTEIFNDTWIESFWDEKAYLLNTLNQIVLVQQMLIGVGCTWLMLDTDYLKDQASRYSDLKNYNDIISQLDLLILDIKNTTVQDSWSWDNQIEHHPSVVQHAAIALKIKKKLNIGSLDLTANQQQLVLEFEAIKNSSTTYLDFESKAKLTEWYKTNNLLGFTNG